MKKYITKQSSIKGAGKGLFTNAFFKKGEVIGLAHVNDQPASEIGRNHNHNEKNPTAYSKKIDNKRFIYASKNLKPGEEITTNYRMQPELEQPEDFMREGGALLTKKVTCKKCGWKWDAEDGGNDITTCHKCGGQGLVHAQDGGESKCPEGYIIYNGQCVEWQEPEVIETDENTGYNAATGEISQDTRPGSIENNGWWTEHEKYHHLQNLGGGASTAGFLGQRPNNTVASDQAIGNYYNRRDTELEAQTDAMIKADPNLKFIPRNKLQEFTEGFPGSNALMYQDPNTEEGEARVREEQFEKDGKSIFPQKQNGGEKNKCKNGEYWNGKKCVLDTSNWEQSSLDSLNLYNKGEKSSGLYNMNYGLAGNHRALWRNESIKPLPEGYTVPGTIQPIGQRVTQASFPLYVFANPPARMAGTQTQYRKRVRDIYAKPVGVQKKPVVNEEPIVEKKIEEKIENLPILKPGLIQQQKYQLQGNPLNEEELELPNEEVESEYLNEGGPDTLTPMESVNKKRRWIDWNGKSVSYRLPRFRKPGHYGDLIKPGKKRYFHLPTIESRNEVYLRPKKQDGGHVVMMSGCPKGMVWSKKDKKCIDLPVFNNGLNSGTFTKSTNLNNALDIKPFDPYSDFGKEKPKKIPVVEDSFLETLEKDINDFLENPLKTAAQISESLKEKGEDPSDALRHSIAGALTAQTIANKTGNIPFISNPLGYLGANIAGIGHELSTLSQAYLDDRPWSVKLQESLEDMYNNSVGANSIFSNKSEKDKINYLLKLTRENKLPDGYGEERPFRDNPKWTDPYNQKQYGGINKFVSGGEPCPEGFQEDPVTGECIPNGGTLPKDYSQFQSFSETLPSNLQDPDFKYGNPDQYNLYGMWETAGKPQSFQDVQDSDYFPLQDDGSYHGFTVGSDGEFLKPMSHGTTWKEVMNSQLNTDPYFQQNRIIKNEQGRLQYVPKKQYGGISNDYIEADLDEDEIEEYRRGGYIVEEINNFQNGGAFDPRALLANATKAREAQAKEKEKARVAKLSKENKNYEYFLKTPQKKAKPKVEPIPGSMQLKGDAYKKNYDDKGKEIKPITLPVEEGFKWDMDKGLLEQKWFPYSEEFIKSQKYKPEGFWKMYPDPSTKEAQAYLKAEQAKEDAKINKEDFQYREAMIKENPEVSIEEIDQFIQDEKDEEWLSRQPSAANNYNDGPIQMVYPEKYFIGPGSGIVGNLFRNPYVMGAGNLYFGAQGISEWADSNSDLRKSISKAWDDPTASNIGDFGYELGMNALNFSGLPFGKYYKTAKNANKIPIRKYGPFKPRKPKTINLNQNPGWLQLPKVNSKGYFEYKKYQDGGNVSKTWEQKTDNYKLNKEIISDLSKEEINKLVSQGYIVEQIN